MKLIIALIGICLVGASCCHRQHVLSSRMDELLECYMANGLARDKGCYVSCAVDKANIRWEGRSYSVSEFERALSDALSRSGMSPSEIQRAPFAVGAGDGSTYGDVVRALEIGEKLGFVVKGVFCVGDKSGASVHGSRRLLLPTFRYGCLVMEGDIKSDERLYVIDLCRDGEIIGNGKFLGNVKEASAGIELTTDARNFRKFLGNGSIVIAIRADSDLDWFDVGCVLNECLLVGNERVFLLGIAGEEPRALSSSNDSVKNYRGLLIGIPCPNCFFWGGDFDDEGGLGEEKGRQL